ncbi:MAG: FecR domain-containing protein [Rhodothermales bacterium]|nr:FecR domain-containing protein [Rhodothermales bacterium]
MERSFEHLETLSGAERTEFLRDLAADDELRREYAMWLAVSEQVRRTQAEVLETDLLVLAALHRAGLESMMDDTEVARVRDAWANVEVSGIDAQFLDDVRDRIAREAADFEESWDLRRGHLSPYRSHERARERSRPIARFAWRISAVAAVVAFVGILLFVARREASWIDMVVPAGQVETLAWTDGSTVRVIGPASARYRRTESDRPDLIELTGDVFLDIVPSAVRFEVETPTATVTVLGTSFGVRSRGDRTDVVLASGSVSVSSRTASDSVCMLAPGQTCYVVGDEPPSEPEDVDLSAALAWANLFVFRATPLPDIAIALSEHFGVHIAVDGSLASEEVTGTFERSRELPEILSVLARTLSARVVATPDGFQLVPDRR